MHDDEIIEQGDIAGLPVQIIANLISNIDRLAHGARVNGAAIAKGDGFGRGIARVAPSAISRDQLIEKHAAAIRQGLDGV